MVGRRGRGVPGYWLVFVVGLLGVALAWATHGRGVSARREAWPFEARAARAARYWLTPRAARDRTNPLTPTAEVLRSGLEHWADHCAACHANDGSGQTTLGRNLFPPAPDMRLPATQGRTDGELFYAIEQGIPFTGMPAWSNGTEAGARSSWELVLFIRHLPILTQAELAEMERLNPRSAADEAREREIDEFLRGGKEPGAGSPPER